MQTCLTLYRLESYGLTIISYFFVKQHESTIVFVYNSYRKRKNQHLLICLYISRLALTNHHNNLNKIFKPKKKRNCSILRRRTDHRVVSLWRSRRWHRLSFRQHTEDYSEPIVGAHGIVFSSNLVRWHCDSFPATGGEGGNNQEGCEKEDREEVVLPWGFPWKGGHEMAAVV